MSFLEILQNRHSVRKYTGEKIPDAALQQVIQAGLLSPSSRSICPWELIVVRDPQTLQKMSECREGAAKMLAGASAAIVVIGDAEKSDVWVEDCSIVMSNMHLMADSLGLGSCWIQGRLRKAENGQSTEDYLREVLGYPAGYALEAILSLGMPSTHPSKRELTDLPMNKVHFEQYQNSGAEE